MVMRILISTLLLAFSLNALYASQDKVQVKLRIQAPSGNLDEATVYFDYGIQPTYDFQQDAEKIFSGVSGVPHIYTLTDDNIKCSINGYNEFNNSQVVSVGVKVDANGTYSLNASQLLNVDETSIVRLEDRDQNIFHDLRMGAYQATIQANDPETGRFFIHVSYPTQFNSTPAGCANDDGIINVRPDNTITWTLCNLYDANNNQLGSQFNFNTNIDFNALPEGTYQLVMAYNNYTVSKNIAVKGTAITASINTITQYVSVGEHLDFHAVTVNASQFEWDFGDGTWIKGVANPTMVFYEPGVYEVELKTTNSTGCYETAYRTIYVAEASSIKETNKLQAQVSAAGNNIRIQLPQGTTTNTDVEIFNLLGERVYNGPMQQPAVTITVDNVLSGIYLVRVSQGNAVSTTKVYIQK